jgi:hypothetical protein
LTPAPRGEKLEQRVGAAAVQSLRGNVVSKSERRRESLRAVVFAQERGTRRVLAAGSLKRFG